MNGWNTTFLLGRPIFRGEPLVSGYSPFSTAGFLPSTANYSRLPFRPKGVSQKSWLPRCRNIWEKPSKTNGNPKSSILFIGFGFPLFSPSISGETPTPLFLLQHPIWLLWVAGMKFSGSREKIPKATWKFTTLAPQTLFF